MKLVGIILIVLGVLALVYQGIQYTTQENLIDIGPLKVTAVEKKTIREKWGREKWGQLTYLPYFQKYRKVGDLERAKDKKIKYSLINPSK